MSHPVVRAARLHRKKLLFVQASRLHYEENSRNMNHVDTPQTRCQAGAAQGDITPPVGIYHRMWGAAVHDRATGVHRPLAATLLWLQPSPPTPLPEGEGSKAAKQAQLIVALDHCILDIGEIERIQAAVGKT